MKELKLGLSGQTETIVKLEDTAWFGDNSLPPVFSTPQLLNLLEYASIDAVKDFYEEGELTVGLAANFTHMAATAVGMKVVAKSELVEINGGVLTFNVTAFDDQKQIAKGTHKRAVINKEKFLKNLEKKND